MKLSVVLLIVLVPLFVRLSREQSLQAWAGNHRRQVRSAVTACSLALIAFTFLVQVAVARYDQIAHDESTMLSLSAALAHGQQVYPLSGSPTEYGLLYGPATYLAYMPPMLSRYHPLTLSLVWGALGFALAIVTFALSLFRRTSAAVACAGTVLLLGMVAPFFAMLWAARADVWVFLAIALSLPAVRLRNRWLAAAAIALLGAILTDLKLPLLLAGLLPCVALWERDRPSRVAAAVAACAMPALAFVPFLLPSISLEGYRQLLSDASHHGFSRTLFLRDLPYAMYMLLPLFVLLVAAWQKDREGTRSWLRQRAAYLLVLGGVLTLALVTGSKNGAGPWHLLVPSIPLASLCTELLQRVWLSAPAFGGSYLGWLAVPLALGIALFANWLLDLVRAAHTSMRGTGNGMYAGVSMPPVERDLEALLQAHRGEVFVMGYTDNAHYYVTSVRPLLQERGMPLFIDSVARNEADLIGKPMSPAVLQAVQECKTPEWILPKAGEPFSMQSGYYGDGSIRTPALYPRIFQQAFEAHHAPVTSSQYFTLWKCTGR